MRLFHGLPCSAVLAALVLTSSWTATLIGANVPVSRSLHSAVWTGTEKWQLVRAVNACAGNGSYDGGSAQHGSRDASLAGAAGACP